MSMIGNKQLHFLMSCEEKKEQEPRIIKENLTNKVKGERMEKLPTLGGLKKSSLVLACACLAIGNPNLTFAGAIAYQTWLDYRTYHGEMIK